jgi:flagellar biogenesis protein FliO
MFFPRSKPRIFHYQPRYYHPADEEGRRIHFERKTLYDPHQTSARTYSLVIVLLLIGLLIWYLFPRLSTVSPQKTRIQFEDVLK